MTFYYPYFHFQIHTKRKMAEELNMNNIKCIYSSMPQSVTKSNQKTNTYKRHEKGRRMLNLRDL